MGEVSLTLAVPTRNRSRLALSAVRSALGQPLPPACEIVVSDNSTEEASAAELRRGLDALPPVLYLRPPTPLSMGEHWDWMLKEILRAGRTSHLVVLTDRFMLRERALVELIERVEGAPDYTLSYNHARIEDYQEPVRIKERPWSGRTIEVLSSRLLALAATGQFPPALPRLLNCVVPRRTLLEVKERYGSVCNSLSPDFCFAFRCLTVEPAIQFYDAQPVVHYALHLSNGTSIVRGVPSSDSEGFLADLEINCASPEPRLMTACNTVFHEYCRVQGERGGRQLPDLDVASYIRANVGEVLQMLPGPLRQRNEAVLRERGWWGGEPPALAAGIGAAGLTGAAQRLVRTLGVCLRKLQARLQAVRWGPDLLWRFLAPRLGVSPPDVGRFEFRSGGEALAFALQVRRRRTRDGRHLESLKGTGSGSLRALPAAGRVSAAARGSHFARWCLPREPGSGAGTAPGAPRPSARSPRGRNGGPS